VLVERVQNSESCTSVSTQTASWPPPPTDAATADASVVPDLIVHLDAPIGSFTADGAYDGRPVYEAVLWAGPARRS
jgi:hypothetical protein